MTIEHHTYCYHHHYFVIHTNAIFPFSELKKTFGVFQEAHEARSANLIEVTKIAY